MNTIQYAFSLMNASAVKHASVPFDNQVVYSNPRCISDWAIKLLQTTKWHSILNHRGLMSISASYY
uniref:Ovule protein n=1 Tax=Heterorhabditis bacteriophora TaxID=37862 RepID=A0A1I7XBP6_HETBA